MCGVGRCVRAAAVSSLAKFGVVVPALAVNVVVLLKRWVSVCPVCDFWDAFDSLVPVPSMFWFVQMSQRQRRRSP